MRHRMERLVILPFSAGCISEASVAVGVPQPRKSKSDTNSPAPTIKGSKGEDDSDSFADENMKSSFKFHDVVPKSNISTGFNRLFKSFKNFSQLFVEKEEELEELEMEMEIGCPTDVQHVTHIGWDGIAATATADPIRGWDSLIPPELLSLYNLSNLNTQLETPSPVKPSAN